MHFPKKNWHTYLGKSTKNRVGNSLFCSKSLILKSDHEWFANIALFKRATWESKSLSKNERFARKIHIFHIFLQFSLFFMLQSESLMLLFFICSFLNSDLCHSLLSLFAKELPERFTQVTHKKGATVSNLLMSLFHLQKMSNLLEKQMSKFLTPQKNAMFYSTK